LTIFSSGGVASSRLGAAPPELASRPILLETAKIENKEIGYYRNGKYGT
jgi:hypothetical protein